MAEKSPTDMNRSASNLSVNSARSASSSLYSTLSQRRRHGLLGKIGTGVQSIFRRFSRAHTSLTEMDIQILMTQTNFTREEIVQWYFFSFSLSLSLGAGSASLFRHERFLADCPSGQMTRKQFVLMYKSLCPRSDADRFARHVFRAFDLDRSNTVDFREFLLGASMTSSTSSPEMKLQWTFHVFDIDGNGLLTRRECLEVIESIVRFQYSLSSEHQQNTLEQLMNVAKRAMMRIFDNNPDLRGDKLTMTQFVQGCLKDDFISQLLTPPLTNSSTEPSTIKP